jgi:hypothetical protein
MKVSLMNNEVAASFKADLRISPTWVIAVMVAAGVALGLATQTNEFTQVECPLC